MSKLVPQLVDVSGKPISMSAYRGASTNNKEFQNWQPHLESADSELSYERDTLVARTRDLSRNNPIASGLAQTYEDSIIGAQFRLSAKPDYVALGKTKKWAREWAKKTEALWRQDAESVDMDAARQLNFHGMTKVVLREGMSAGEALAIPVWMPKRKTKTAIQLVDCDRLSTPDYEQNSTSMRDGIEVDSYGAPKAYNVLKAHPNEYWGAEGLERDWVRIPARTRFDRRQVIHVFTQTRPGQHRSPPAITSIMGDFKMFDTYRRSELKSAISNSLISAFIETTASAEDIANLFNADSKEFSKQRNEWQAQLEAGAMISLFPGDKLNAFTPSRPATAYSSYVENMLRTMSAGANIPYEIFLKDFSKVNYSSARAAILEAWRFFLGRRQWLSDMWATPVYELWLEEKIHAGIIEAPGFYNYKTSYTRCKWIGGGRGWVDEFKEANSALLRIQGLISTYQDECEIQGKDWEAVFEQQAVELSYKAELETEFSIKFPTPQGAVPVVAEDDENADDSKKDDDKSGSKDEKDDDTRMLAFMG